MRDFENFYLFIACFVKIRGLGLGRCRSLGSVGILLEQPKLSGSEFEGEFLSFRGLRDRAESYGFYMLRFIISAGLETEIVLVIYFF